MSEVNLKPIKAKNPRKVGEIFIGYISDRKIDAIKIHTSRDIYDFSKQMYLPGMIDHKEYFYVILLNNGNRIIDYYKVSDGSITATMVDKKVLFQAVLNRNAVGIAIVHNHPSGNLMPSQSDINLTKSIEKACKIMDVTLLDHLIVSSEGYLSFRDEGLL